MLCGSDCSPKNVFGSSLNAFAIAVHAAGEWSWSRIGGWSSACCVPGAAHIRLSSV